MGSNSVDSRCVSLSFINIMIFYFVNVSFIFIPMFDLVLILLKNNLNGNKIMSELLF